MRTLLGALPLIGCVAMTWGCARMMRRRSASASPVEASPEEARQLDDPTGPAPTQGDGA